MTVFCSDGTVHGKLNCVNRKERTHEYADDVCAGRRGQVERSGSMKCPTCGKELYDTGEGSFNCPFCGAEVVGGIMAAEATAGGELSKVKPGLQELIEAMRRSDLEAVVRIISNADKSFKIGVLVFVLFILLSVVAAVLISRVIVQ